MNALRATWYRLRRTDGAERTANRTLQAAIVTALLEGLRRRDPSVIVNGVASLAFAATPGYLRTRYGARLRPWQRLWISAAGVVHTLGMLGPYDRIWWWDHLAHTLSGVVVAGATDVTVRTAAERSGRGEPSARNRSAIVLAVTVALGVGWEVLEYVVHAVAGRLGFEPLLVHYGRRDAIGDVVFDLLGAVLVILFGRRAFENIVESATRD